jgi:hypothetical protein
MTTPYPQGAIPSVEPYHSYSAFLQAVEPEYTLVKYTDMRTLVNRGETAASYFPAATDVITTTTIRDTPLNLLSWDQELEHVRDFRPDYHIPADYSTYEQQEVADRSRNVLHCMEGLLWMQRQLREHDSETQLIPLVKGVTPEERALCYEVFDCAASMSTVRSTARSTSQAARGFVSMNLWPISTLLPLSRTARSS